MFSKIASTHTVLITAVIAGGLFFVSVGSVAAAGSEPPTRAESQPPGDCELGKNHQAKNCTQRCDCGGAACGYRCDNSGSYYGNDYVCARSRIGIPTYTAKMTTFSDVRCAGGPCNHAIAGIAHRVFPLNCKVEVCNLKNGLCAVGIVMDRGPNVCFPDRVIDANIKLKADLRLTGSDEASYKLLSCPGVTETAEPSGPARASLEALIEAQKRGDFAPGYGPQQTYTAVNTPWGPGYLGTPPPLNSSIYTGQQTNPFMIPPNPYQPYPQSTPTPSSATSASAIGDILAQPKSIKSGWNIVVSWSSVNMSDSEPCKIFVNDTQFLAQGNEGTRKIQAGPGLGPESFTMKCKDSKGNAFEQKDSVVVQ